AHSAGTSSTRSWKLYSLALSSDQSTMFTDPATPQLLQQGTFDQKTAPSWVHTPVQGIWFTQNSLLVTSIDQKGTSHLEQYLFKKQENTTTTKAPSESTTQEELANAHDGHILTSPTANSNGTSIYWSEEWLNTDNTLHSTIWTQQTVA